MELFDLEAAEFCSINGTYREDYRRVLELRAEARFPIDRCADCGFVYARWLPSAEFLNKVYEEVIVAARAEEISRVLGGIGRRMEYVGKLLQLLVPRRQGMRVLDFGCGFGFTAKILASSDLDTIAYDTSPLRIAMLERAHPHLRATAAWADVKAATPLGAVVIDNVLEHVPDPAATVEELSTLCESGALLYVSVPSYEQATLKALARARAVASLTDMTLNPWEHLNYFDLAHLDSLMRRCSFEPLAPCELGRSPNIGLRPEARTFARAKNGLASAVRLARFVATGSAVETVQDRFYRRARRC